MSPNMTIEKLCVISYQQETIDHWFKISGTYYPSVSVHQDSGCGLLSPLYHISLVGSYIDIIRLAFHLKIQEEALLTNSCRA